MSELNGDDVRRDISPGRMEIESDELLSVRQVDLADGVVDRR
jgi:hypothetical protein